MPLRAQYSYASYLRQFLAHDLDVVCPVCGKKAVVKPGDYLARSQHEAQVKALCPHCGFSRRYQDVQPTPLYASARGIKYGRVTVFGRPIDPFFQLPLWFTDDFEGETLWAYNLEHLHFLRQHIAAPLRERHKVANANSSLGSRLPKWMLAKHHREALLKKLAALEKR